MRNSISIWLIGGLFGFISACESGDGDGEDQYIVSPCDTECAEGNWQFALSVEQPSSHFIDDEVDAGLSPMCQGTFLLSGANMHECDWENPSYFEVYGDEEQIFHTDDCEAGSGWAWKNEVGADRYEQMAFCGDACAKIQNGEWSKITIYIMECY